MAFPQVAATNSGNSGGNSTTHTVNLPAGIIAGQLLLVAFGNDGTATASVTTPAAGWNTLFSNDFGAGGTPRLTAFWRVADGGEGSTITVTTSASEGSAHCSYGIGAWDSATNPEAGTSSENQSATPDPPTLNPANWDVEDTLWIALMCWDAGNSGTVSFPANYTGSQTQDRWNNASGVVVAMASRENATASENPGAFGAGATVNWVAGTIGVRPVTSGGQTRVRVASVVVANT